MENNSLNIQGRIPNLYILLRTLLYLVISNMSDGIAWIKEENGLSIISIDYEDTVFIDTQATNVYDYSHNSLKRENIVYHDVRCLVFDF